MAGRFPFSFTPFDLFPLLYIFLLAPFSFDSRSLLILRDRCGRSIFYRSPLVVSLGILQRNCWVNSLNFWANLPDPVLRRACILISSAFWEVKLLPQMRLYLFHFFLIFLCMYVFLHIRHQWFGSFRGQTYSRKSMSNASSRSQVQCTHGCDIDSSAWAGNHFCRLLPFFFGWYCCFLWLFAYLILLDLDHFDWYQSVGRSLSCSSRKKNRHQQAPAGFCWAL
jgi:hypothetical protein